MIETRKDSPARYDKGRDDNNAWDIIMISNASKYAFCISHITCAYNDLYREFDVEFPEDAPYGEYTYVLCHSTGAEWALSREILDSKSDNYTLRDIMIETGLLVYVDEEEKTAETYREKAAKSNAYTYRKRGSKTEPQPKPVIPKYSYAANVTPSTATVKWYVDSTKAVEVTELTNTDYASLYAYCEADGYISQGTTVQGIENGTVTVSIVLEKKEEPKPVTNNTKITYTSTDGNVVTSYELRATDAAGNGLSYTNTYTNGQGVIEFDGVASQVYMSFKWCSTLKTFDGISNRVELNTAKSMFYDCSSLTSIDVSNFNTSQVTDMSYMFYNCSSLTSIDVSGFNTSKVTNMGDMFNGCSSLTSLNVSNFDTSSVILMEGMFYNCLKLTSLDLSGFDTSRVANMGWMFYYCSKLTSLDVSGFDTSRVTVMSYMFHNCKALTSLDVSGFDTSSVAKMLAMFFGCSSLTSIDVSGFNTSKVTDMGWMFRGCSSLTSLDVSGFNTSQVTDMSYMFNGCSSLTTLDVSGFDTSQVTDMSYMFAYCSSLTSIDVGNFDTSSVILMEGMFDNCLKLTSLDLSGFDTSQVTDMFCMFKGCSSLTPLKIGTNCTIGTSTTTDSMFENLPSSGTLNYPSGMSEDDYSKWTPTGWTAVAY